MFAQNKLGNFLSLLLYNEAEYEHAALWDCAEFNWSFGPVWKAKGWRQQVKRPNAYYLILFGIKDVLTNQAANHNIIVSCL